MPNGSSIESAKPSFSEIVEGRDVALAEEIVKNLVSEGIVVPVYYYEPGKRKTEVAVDRRPGQENYSVTEKLKREGTLLGAIVPSGESEFVYIGIRESGLVIKIEDARFNDWYSRKRIATYDTNDTTFRECISLGSFERILMTEDENPEEFNKRVVAAVETARVEAIKNKERRADARDNLKRALFGGQK